MRGEVSNCKEYPSGHIYFTLKDEKGTLNCVMFANYRRGLSFPLGKGQRVVAEGYVDVYERDGKYQLCAKAIRMDGEGDLARRLEELKRKLQERGMFAAEYKQPIPRYIKTLGVVTAATGAAVRDIINVARRRNPYVRIILYPAVVQGEAAAPSIVRGIRALERLGVDAMIVGRGGGSAEDLWAFNEEMVVQAVFDCMVPVISAVGHETDTTLIDYVADLRAPTPSAAAELAVFDYYKFAEALTESRKRLLYAVRGKLQLVKMKVDREKHRLVPLSPLYRIRERRFHCLRMEEQMKELMQRRLEQMKHRLSLQAERLDGVSPLKKLQQGYAYVSDRQERRIQSIHQTAPGEELLVAVADGRILTVVSRIEPFTK